jgi:hypothetical protein
MVCGRELRVELENLVVELPGATQRREPILCPAKRRLTEVRVCQPVPCQRIIRVEIERALQQLLRVVDVGGVEALVGLLCLDGVLPGFRFCVPRAAMRANIVPLSCASSAPAR